MKRYSPKIFNLFILGYLMITLTGCPQQAVAQDPVFSQFHAAPLQLNPALTGTIDAAVVHLNYRNQWPALNQAYNTFSASFSQYAPSLNSGFGVALMGDIAGNGIYNSTHVNLLYAYNLQFNDNFYIRMGMEAGFANKRLNFDKLIFLDQINIETGPYSSSGGLNPTNELQPTRNVTYFDAGFGGLVHTPYFYAGISIKHINAPREGFYRYNNNFGELPPRLTLHTGGEIPLNAHNKYKTQAFLYPNVLFAKQRQFHQLNVGGYGKYGVLLGGLWFRHTFTNADAVIFMLGFEQKVVKLAYSYDLTVSRLGAASGGAHEIALIFNFKSNLPKNDYNDCLKMFR